MSYNGSGTFVINTSGQPVVTGTVISSTAFNALTADLGTGLSTAITKDGQTATTARIPFAAGINSTLVTDSASTVTGSIITAGGVGIAKALYVGTTANFGGVATYSAQPIFSSLTASSAVATDASKGLVSVTNTGTGNNVLATSPTLVTPALGTPSALVGTNITGTATAFTASNVTTNANLTGMVTSVGNAASLGSFTSAQLLAAVTDETGTGSVVFATSPTLVTPLLGTPTSGNLANCTGIPAPAALTTASGSAPSYSARAWVNFNGIGTVAIRASGNVSSITDNGTGNYTVNMATAMSDANYSMVATAQGVAATYAALACEDHDTNKTTSAVVVLTSNRSSGAAADAATVNVSIFR
jgi:hypothetical protein